MTTTREEAAPHGYFETEFGDQIRLQPEVERVLTPKSDRDRAYYEKHLATYYATESGAQSTSGTPVSIKQIENDVQTFALLVDFLEELRVIPSEGFGRVLDVGGAEGVHAALFRGLFARHAEVADLRDGRDPALSRKLLSALARRFPLHAADLVFDRLPPIESLVTRLTGKRLPRRNSFKRINAPSLRNYYRYGFRREPTVDSFHVGDWRQTVDGTYDVVLSFQSFWLFEHRAAFRRIAGLLRPGGLFAALVPYCWCGRSTGDARAILGGAVPCFEQRLTRRDIERYYQQYKPDRAEYVGPAYDAFDPGRPSIRNYVDAGLDAGLALVGYKRLAFKQPYALTHKGRIVAPESANAGATGITVDVDELLGNIRRFRQDIAFEDLLTRSVLLVLRRVETMESNLG